MRHEDYWEPGGHPKAANGQTVKKLVFTPLAEKPWGTVRTQESENDNFNVEETIRLINRDFLISALIVGGCAIAVVLASEPLYWWLVRGAR